MDLGNCLKEDAGEDEELNPYPPTSSSLICDINDLLIFICMSLFVIHITLMYTAWQLFSHHSLYLRENRPFVSEITSEEEIVIVIPPAINLYPSLYLPLVVSHPLEQLFLYCFSHIHTHTCVTYLIGTVAFGCVWVVG